MKSSFIGTALLAASLSSGTNTVWSQATSGSTPARAASLSAGMMGLLASVPSGQAVPDVLRLSLSDAINWGLRHNLAILVGEQDVESHRGAQLRARSALLPNITASVGETGEQINLAALGFTPSEGIPAIIGPFSVFDARATLSQAVWDKGALNRLRAEGQNLKASEHSYNNTRDLVVLTCATLYLRAVSGSSRVDAARSQLNTARTLFNLATDQKSAGLAAGIEVLRAQVEMQAMEQRLIVAETDLADAKLDLAHAIGLPLGQQFDLTDQAPYAAIGLPTLDEALQQAYRDRADYQSSMARLRAAESSRKAAADERMPSVRLHADYGDIGENPGNSHGTFTVAATLQVPIFQGGLVRGKLIEADALLKQRQAELEDLKSQIYYELQSAFLNLKAADDRVKVAKSSISLADAELTQAQDRFKAGVASNIEVVHAQDAVAAANENFIASLFAYNQAKASLARGLGGAEKSFQQLLLGGTH